MPEICHKPLSKVRIFSACHAHRRQATGGKGRGDVREERFVFGGRGYCGTVMLAQKASHRVRHGELGWALTSLVRRG
ncbi:MAG: hypothetical protein ACREJ8_03395 [Candidatus Methylomirabilales bacterium]